MEIIILDKKICQVEQKLNCFMTKRRSEEGIGVRQKEKYKGANIPKLSKSRPTIREAGRLQRPMTIW
jgi:hypothetical protein